MSEQVQKLKIKKLPIRLGQFLKLANLVSDGFEARMVIQNGEVLVNGCPEKRRGKKLYHRDTVTLNGRTWVVEIEDCR